MFLLGLGIFVICINIILMTRAVEDGFVAQFILSSLGLVGGIIILLSSLFPKLSPEQICEDYAICYELVETIAEYTDYSEQDIAQFFAIVCDDIEPYEAIKMLDSSLTDEQIDAIMEISAMKQAE